MCGGRRVSGLLRKADEARHSSIFRKHHFDAPLDRSSWPSQAAKHREKTTRSADRRIVAAIQLSLESRESIPRGVQDSLSSRRSGCRLVGVLCWRARCCGSLRGRSEGTVIRYPTAMRAITASRIGDLQLLLLLALCLAAPAA